MFCLGLFVWCFVFFGGDGGGGGVIILCPVSVKWRKGGYGVWRDSLIFGWGLLKVL